MEPSAGERRSVRIDFQVWIARPIPSVRRVESSSRGSSRTGRRVEPPWNAYFGPLPMWNMRGTRLPCTSDMRSLGGRRIVRGFHPRKRHGTRVAPGFHVRKVGKTRKFRRFRTIGGTAARNIEHLARAPLLLAAHVPSARRTSSLLADPCGRRGRHSRRIVNTRFFVPIRQECVHGAICSGDDSAWARV